MLGVGPLKGLACSEDQNRCSADQMHSKPPTSQDRHRPHHHRLDLAVLRIGLLKGLACSETSRCSAACKIC